MDFQTALRLTMARFKIRSRDLAVRAGIREASLSEIRNGGDAKLSTFSKLLNALEEEQLEYFKKVLIS